MQKFIFEEIEVVPGGLMPESSFGDSLGFG